MSEYHKLPLTFQSPTPRRPVNKRDWQQCAACGRSIPVSYDRVSDSTERLTATRTYTYVCPWCEHCHIGAPGSWSMERRPQAACHNCGTACDAHQCPVCKFPRGWTRVSCPYCENRQVVHAPHLEFGCDVFTLDCVQCESRFDSLCIC